MADDLLTVADFVADALNLSDAEVTDLSLGAPLLMALPIEMSSDGVTHRYNKETGAPVVGFRDVNAGREFDSSVDTVAAVTLKILDFSWMVDKALAASWRKGGAEALIAREGRRHLKAAMFAAEKQFINGTITTSGGASGGFSGMANAVSALAGAMMTDAGGTTATTGSSVYLVTGTPDKSAVAGVMIEGNPFDIGDYVVQNFIDGSGLHFPVYYTPACTWIGLQVGGAYDIGRICNLTEDSGKGLTDDLIYTALSKFPGGRTPTHIVMNRRSQRQLRESRTATNATGAPAPLPTEVQGIPILITEAITSTEALLS